MTKQDRLVEALLTHALRQTSEASDAFNDRLVVIQASRKIEQPDLAAASLFEQLAKTADKPAATFKSLAQTFYLEAEAKARAIAAASNTPPAAPRLNVEMGPRSLVFEDHRRVTASWRHEAEKQALVLHAIAAAYADGDHAAMQTLLKPYQGPFNVTLWEAAVKADVPKKGDLTPKIIGG